MNAVRDIIRLPSPLRLKHRIEDDEIVIIGHRGSYPEARKLAWAILGDLEMSDYDQARAVILSRIATSPRSVADLQADTRLSLDEVHSIFHGLIRQSLIRRSTAQVKGQRKGPAQYELTPQGVGALAEIVIEQFGLT